MLWSTRRPLMTQIHPKNPSGLRLSLNLVTPPIRTPDSLQSPITPPLHLDTVCLLDERLREHLGGIELMHLPADLLSDLYAQLLNEALTSAPTPSHLPLCHQRHRPTQRTTSVPSC
jgi:hypothetical protein